VNSTAYCAADKNIIAKVFDGELTLINLANGQYYAAGGSAVEFWETVASGATVDDIVRVLSARYGSSEDLVRGEVQRLVDLFRQNGLIAESPAVSPSSEIAAPAPVKEWQQGWLEVYGDMKDLLLLDPIHDVEQEWPAEKKD
jgi:hypothetical protein